MTRDVAVELGAVERAIRLTRRALLVPSLYRTHRRGGLTRGIAARLAWSVVGHGAPHVGLDLDEAERVLSGAIAALPPIRAAQRAYALEVLEDVLAIARAAQVSRPGRRGRA